MPANDPPRNHRLIAGLADRYADSMCSSDPDCTFSRAAIAAAYIIGAQQTLRRFDNIIAQSVAIGALTPIQADTIRQIIAHIEATPPSAPCP